MDIYNPYVEVIGLCIVLIISYNFDLIAKYTNVPSVLLLIVLGIAIKHGFIMLGVETGEIFFTILEVVGIVGLIMIVLEGTLELELTKEKRPLIVNSFLISLISLGLTSHLLALLFRYLMVDSFTTALIYAVPFSILSSSIIIPSVKGLIKSKKEFLIYESVFSDILGIMFFFFLVSNAGKASVVEIVLSVSVNILITIGVSVIIGYILVILINRINSTVKLFLLISVLVLLYSIGKLMHFSSLVMVLIFGLILNNHKVFFKGRIEHLIDDRKLVSIVKDFHTLTMESAFSVRTFFFVIFGITLELDDLTNLNAAIISLAIVAAIFSIRIVCLKIFRMKNIITELFIAPRGLITILLFFSIPASFHQAYFNTGILLYTILFSSIIMAIILVVKRKQEEHVEELVFDDWDELDGGISKPSVKSPKK